MLAPMSNRSRFVLGALAALALSSIAPTAHAWPTVDPAGHRVPVLAGRWTVVMPESTARAVATPPPNAPPSREELDSAGLYQDPDGNFAVRGTLLESTRPDDLAAAVRALPAPCATPSYGTIGERADLVAVRCTEPSPDGAFRPLTVYAVHTDGWVDRIEAMVEPHDPEDSIARTAGGEYAEAVLATLSAGEAPAAVERGTIEVARACVEGEAADPLTITLPSDWIAIRDTLGDGQLLRMTRAAPLGGDRAMVAVELAPAGTPPPRAPEGVGTHATGTLLGSTVDWLVLHQDGAPTAVRQTASELTVECGGGASFARALRLSIGGPTATLDDAQHVLETLALGGGRGHAATLSEVSSEAPTDDVAAAEGASDDEDAALEAEGRSWSIGIGVGSVVLLAAALALRARASAGSKPDTKSDTK